MSQTRLRRIRLSIPPEGFVFLVVLGFVTVCSVLRSVNMLVVVSGMMLVALLLCWRLSRYAVRNVVVRREVPNQIHTGQAVNIQWPIANHGNFAIFRLKLTDTITQTSSRLGSLENASKKKRPFARPSITYSKIEAGQTNYDSYRILFAERGTYQLGPVTVENQFPLALINSWFRTQHTNSINVAPQIGTLASNWDQIFRTISQGSSSRSNIKGTQEEEFYAIREWRSGDNLRNIHWRSSARKMQPMVKQFDRIIEQDRTLFVDLFADTNDSIDFLKVSNECELALSFSTSAIKQWLHESSGAFHLTIAGEEVVRHDSSQQVDFVSQCMKTLAVARHTPAADISRELQQTLDKTSPETSCLVVSTRSIQNAESMLDTGLLSKVRWLQVDSQEFRSVFSVNSKVDQFSTSETVRSI